MCYMAVYPPGVMPKLKHLIEGSNLNPDGNGWSVGTDEVHRSLRPAEIARFADDRERRPDETAIFHARTSTGGATSLRNCQPLVLEDGTILAHNGALFGASGPKSDTRVFAGMFLPKWDLDDLDQRQELRGLIYPSKMVILRPGKPVVMLNDRLGIWEDDGSWHSNTDYFGLDHTRAGVCSACGTVLSEAEGLDQPKTLCFGCRRAYADRRIRLAAAGVLRDRDRW